MAFSPGKSPPAINLLSVLTKTNKILISHPRHFISLTLLFVLPFSVILTPKYILHVQALTTQIISIVVTFFLSLIASGTVSFSVHQILSGHHVKLVTSIKSLKRSLLPLLFTSLCSALVQFAALFGFMFIYMLGVILIGFGILGSQITQIMDPPNSLNWFVILTTAIIFVLIMYFQVNFALSSVIAAVELSYGFQSLRKSSYLVKGTRRVILKLILIYQIIAGFVMLGVWFLRGDTADLMMMKKNWMFVCGIVISVVLNMIMILHYLVAITVLFVSCKIVHGEPAGGGASDDVAVKYVSLPFDDGKLEHGVSLVPTIK